MLLIDHIYEESKTPKISGCYVRKHGLDPWDVKYLPSTIHPSTYHPTVQNPLQLTPLTAASLSFWLPRLQSSLIQPEAPEKCEFPPVAVVTAAELHAAPEVQKIQG
jgi:hypothetical protein